MTSFILPIVGSHYRPPATAILSILPLNQPLELVPEPTNIHDPNAIAVWIDGRELQLKEPVNPSIVEKFSRLHFTISDILSDYWHLGYIPKERAAEIHLPGPIPGQFRVGSNGGPRISFTLNEAIP